jgi:hypothetical protein
MREKILAEAAEAGRLAAEDKNGSRSWWLARQSGLLRAADILARVDDVQTALGWVVAIKGDMEKAEKGKPEQVQWADLLRGQEQAEAALRRLTG